MSTSPDRSVWLKYSLIADQVTLKREEVEANPGFGAFEFFTAPESGNLYPLTELQWRILFHSVARYCRRHADGAARTEARGKH